MVYDNNSNEAGESGREPSAVLLPAAAAVTAEEDGATSVESAPSRMQGGTAPPAAPFTDATTTSTASATASKRTINEPSSSSPSVAVTEPLSTSMESLTISQSQHHHQPNNYYTNHHQLTLEECLYGERGTPITIPQTTTMTEAPDDPSSTNESNNNNNNNNSDDHDDDDDDVLSVTLPHAIHLAELRRIVSASGILDAHDDSSDDDDCCCGGGAWGGDDESNRNHNHNSSCNNNNGSRSHRAVAWRVLLGYLPPATADWTAAVTAKRQLYRRWAADLFHDVSDVAQNAHELQHVRRGRRPHNDSNNSNLDNPNSSWHSSAASTSPSSSTDNNNNPNPIPNVLQQHWKKKELDLDVLERTTRGLNALKMTHIADDSCSNNEAPLDDFVESALLLDSIRKDVVRTHPDMAFFLDPTGNRGRRRYAALERILLVWSKHNGGGIRYVQGMNEIAGILYFVLANDGATSWAACAEADAHWLFHILLAEMSDVFVPGLDRFETGITGRIDALRQLLHRHDPEVAEHLQEMGVEMSFFAIRWWTTLLSREFLLPDTIRLWDSMFASTHKDNFLRYMCVTMILSAREQLLKSDFARCLKLLHSFPTTNMEELLQESRALWVYESQVSVACHRGGLSLHQALRTIRSPPALAFAFGFPRGTPAPATAAEPPPPPSPLERQRSARRQGAEERARNAAKVLGSKTRGLFSSGLQRFKAVSSSGSSSFNNKFLARANSVDNALTVGRQGSSEVADFSEANEEDDVYLAAILNTS